MDETDEAYHGNTHELLKFRQNIAAVILKVLLFWQKKLINAIKLM